MGCGTCWQGRSREGGSGPGAGGLLERSSEQSQGCTVLFPAGGLLAPHDSVIISAAAGFCDGCRGRMCRRLDQKPATRAIGLSTLGSSTSATLGWVMVKLTWPHASQTARLTLTDVTTRVCSWGHDLVSHLGRMFHKALSFRQPPKDILVRDVAGLVAIGMRGRGVVAVSHVACVRGDVIRRRQCRPRLHR